VATALGLGACAGAPAERRLTIFVASSLRDATEALAAAYEVDHPGVRIVVAADASSTLRVQIEQGAPADVFAPASPEEIEPLEAAGLTRAEPILFATADIVLAAPADGSPMRDPFGLAAPGVRIVAASPEVPISRYAAEVVERLASSSAAPPDFAAQVADNVVSEEANARAVLAKLELGEADAGFAYAPDLRGRAALREIPLPADATITASYAAVALAASREPDLAAAFVAWLVGPEAEVILHERGFGSPT
jgi:molybdate transport system substrate-binding protein